MSINGFENYRFIHNPIPEIDFDEIDVSTCFLGKKLKSPLLISSMTGGSKELGLINQKLARVAEQTGIAIGVGSQRILIEMEKKYKKNKTLKKEYHEILNSFAVRKFANPPLLFGNFGAIQLNNKIYYADIKRAKDLIDADGMFLHLNSLQEAVQIHGNTNFKNLLQKIEEVVTLANFPVIIKEVGNGLSRDSVMKMKKAGIKFFDVAGAGGTSWVKIECIRRKDDEKIDFGRVGENFQDWGNKTVEVLNDCRDMQGINLIASGGIRNGIEAAKAIALGAKLVGIGLPFIKSLNKSESDLIREIETIIFELKLVMFSVGAKNLEDLKKIKLVKFLSS